MECVVCLDKSDNSVSCTNKKCTINICTYCLLNLFKYSRNNRSLPLCPGIGCNYHYNWKELSKEHQIAYSSALYSYFSSVYSGDVDLIRNKPMLIEDLKKKRIEYLSIMPAAILHVVEIALASKLKKAKKKFEKEGKEDYRRKCMNLRCSGILNDEFTCIVCYTRFCSSCEKRWTENHSCVKDDVESLSTIRSMVHCPACNLAIEKSEGCNHMTCAYCGKKFEYTTGKDSDSGSLNRSVIIKEIPLSLLWKDLIENTPSPNEYMKQIILLEGKIIRIPTEKKIISLIASSKEEDNIYLPLLKAFSQFYNHLTKYREYVNIVDEIQYKMTKNELSLKELTNIINSL